MTLPLRDSSPGSSITSYSSAPARPSSKHLEHSDSLRISPDRGGGGDALHAVLLWISEATPATGGTAVLCIAAVLYLVLGRVGLILIGALGGVLLWLSYESRHPDVSRALQGEKGIDVLQRLWENVTNDSSKRGRSGSKGDVEPHFRYFDDFPQETKSALNNLVDAILKTFVKSWYAVIAPFDHSFPLSCRRALSSLILNMSNQLYRKRPADSFLDFLTNSSSIVIVFLSELSAAFSETPSDSGMTVVDTVYRYLASNPESHLSNLLSQKQQTTKLRMVSQDLLRFLDRPLYECDPVRVFLKELLGGAVLESILNICSRPEWINGWIVHLLEAGEPDLSQAIDVGMQPDPQPALSIFPDIDGNLGNTEILKPTPPANPERQKRKSSRAHKKRLSKAEEEMEEAVVEMKRLNEMIAEDDARRVQETTPSHASQRLVQAIHRNERELELMEDSPTKENLNPNSDSKTDQTPDPDRHLMERHSISEPDDLLPRPLPTADRTGYDPVPEEQADFHFTSFDQIVPPCHDDSEIDSSQKAPPSLHNATILISDDAVNDKGKIRTKPTCDYLIQVEPASSAHPGWMIVRKYNHIESLHEVLRRIATISGATAFIEQHNTLPNWKGHTRASLRGELERYLRDACWFSSLADSEGMKRFLDKDQGNMAASSNGLKWDTVGKGVLDVLTIAPKGAVEGGKAVVSSVTGVLGNIGLGRKTSLHHSSLPEGDLRSPASIPTRPDGSNSTAVPRKIRDSMDSQRSIVISTQPGKVAPMDRHNSLSLAGETENELSRRRVEPNERVPRSSLPSRSNSRASSIGLRSASTASSDRIKLAPPPYESLHEDESTIHDTQKSFRSSQASVSSKLSTATPALFKPPLLRRQPTYSPLSEQETAVAVELIFAIINELYTLSSAWNIRRTLLAAAKTFLLRPGNPSLVSIQALIQKSVLDDNTSDDGIATHLRKIRASVMPTDAERASWPAPPTQDDMERLRVKARRLLIDVGVPTALKGVMGQAATSEALGRVFDSLQIEEVSRGLVFGILLQAIRAVTH